MKNSVQNCQVAEAKLAGSLLLAEGVELTIDHDTVMSSGNNHFKKGQKVKVREVWKTEAKWSNFYNMWVPEKVHGVKLENEYGIYFLSLFTETKHACR